LTDQYAALAGMMCGFALPYVQKLFETLESGSKSREWLIKGAISAAFIGLTIRWYFVVFLNEKHVYNALHPYYEMVPIL
jgi:hypothetical protein